MINYTIGDKVVCLTDHDSTHGQTIFKGNYYVINGMKKCTCGIILVDVGKELPLNGSICVCGKIHDGYNWWLKATRFTKNDKKVSVENVSEFMEVFTTQKK